MDIQAPASLFRLALLASCGDIPTINWERMKSAVAMLEVRVLARPLLIAARWLPMHNGVAAMMLSMRTAVQVTDAVWRSSAVVVGEGTPIPAYFTGRDMSVRSLGGGDVCGSGSAK